MGAFHFLRFTDKSKVSYSADGFLNLKRLGIFALLVVFISSFIASSGIGNLFPKEAYAAGTASSCQFSASGWKWNGDKNLCVASTYTPDQEVSSLSYYAGLTDCIGNRMRPSIQLTISDNKVAQPSAWFDNSDFWNNIRIGDLYKTANVYPDGDTSCADVVTKAMSLWGWGNDYVQFLTDIGYTYNSKTTTWNEGGGGDSQRNPHFQAAVKAKVYNNFTSSLPPLTDAATYIEALHFFVGQTSASGNVACNAQDLGVYPDLGGVTGYKSLVDSRKVVSADDKAFGNPAIKTATNGTNVYIRYDKATILDGATRSGVQHGYVFVEGATQGSALPINVYDIQAYGTPKTETCDQILKDINNNVGAYAVYAKNNTATPVTDPTQTCQASDTACSAKTGASSCVIDGIGWIVCPIVNFLANVADGAFGFLSDNFLRTDTSIVSTSGPTYTVWQAIRNIANVTFVIVFLIIIFSQLTSLGITNYGVKKMLPRLVVAAILVNLSYFVCQVAVDLSNILGYSIKDFLNGLGARAVGTNTAQAVQVSPFADGSGFAGLAGGILAAAGIGAVLYTMLGTLVPVLLAAVVGLVMILFILVARQALIILLIALSPLAFVAFLLPNTEKLFTQWRKALTSMLLLFPIIALVFGISSLAATILSQTFNGGFSDTATATPNKWFGQIIAAAVMILPLFVVPTLLKKSLDGIGTLGSSIGKLGGRLGGGLGKAGGAAFENTALMRGRAIRKQGRANYRNEKFAKAVAKGGARAAFAKGPNLIGAQKYANAALERSAVATSLQLENKELEAAKDVMVNTNMSGTQRHELATTGSTVVNGKTYSGETMQRAAIQEQFRVGSYGQQAEILKATTKGPNGEPAKLAKFNQTIANSVASNGLGSKDPALAGKRIDEISQGDFNYDTAVKDAIKEGKYTADTFATMNDDARENVIKIASTAEAAGNPSLMQALRSAAQGIQNSPEVHAKLSTSEKAVQQINGLASSGTSGTSGGSGTGGLILPGDNEFKIH